MRPDGVLTVIATSSDPTASNSTAYHNVLKYVTYTVTGEANLPVHTLNGLFGPTPYDSSNPNNGKEGFIDSRSIITTNSPGLSTGNTNPFFSIYDDDWQIGVVGRLQSWIDTYKANGGQQTQTTTGFSR